MHFTKLAVLGFLGLAVAAPAAVVSKSRRSASDIESDIATVSSELTTLDGNINSFSGSLLQALGLLVDFNSLTSDVTTATSAVTSTGALSSGDSATVYGDVSSLTTQIVQVLSDAAAKASTVASAGYTSNVLSALQTLQTDADAFFVALEGTVDSSYTSMVESLQSTVDAAFKATLADY